MWVPREVKDIGSPDLEVKRLYEPPDVDTGNQTSSGRAVCSLNCCYTSLQSFVFDTVPHYIEALAGLELAV